MDKLPKNDCYAYPYDKNSLHKSVLSEVFD